MEQKKRGFHVIPLFEMINESVLDIALLLYALQFHVFSWQFGQFHYKIQFIVLLFPSTF